jgi:hypothetical protein
MKGYPRCRRVLRLRGRQLDQAEGDRLLPTERLVRPALVARHHGHIDESVAVDAALDVCRATRSSRSRAGVRCCTCRARTV